MCPGFPFSSYLLGVSLFDLCSTQRRSSQKRVRSELLALISMKWRSIKNPKSCQTNVKSYIVNKLQRIKNPSTVRNELRNSSWRSLCVWSLHIYLDILMQKIAFIWRYIATICNIFSKLFLDSLTLNVTQRVVGKDWPWMRRVALIFKGSNHTHTQMQIFLI